MTIRCYAQRLLNPFRGIINVIEYEGAEAVTMDGVFWDIYVRNAELVKDFENADRVQTSDIRYGSWSVAEGLKRGPIQPSEDFKRMEQQGYVVYEHLLKHHREVPFAFADHYELWLLDKSQQPLALLNSTTKLPDFEIKPDLLWRGGYLCQHTFMPAALEYINTSIDNAADYLTHYINSCAQQPPQAQWFLRHHGCGTALHNINLPSEFATRELPQAAFPHLLVSTANHDEYHQPLIDAFLLWQAPRLLLLQHLLPDIRARYEALARQQALLVEKHWHLYPEVVDKTQISAARVEAQLRKAQPKYLTQEDEMSIFYIELGKSERGK